MIFRKQWKYLVGAIFGAIVLAATSVFTFFPESILGFLTDRHMADLGMVAKSVTVNGKNIHYIEGGHGKETLLLVHGFRSSKAYWISYIPEFYSQYHVIALDLPGHGLSQTSEDQHYDLKSLGAFLNDFVQALNLKDIHIVGTSMGGGTVLSYAAEHSDNIRSLAVINPLAVQPPELSEVHEALGRGENLLLPVDWDSFYVMQEVVYGSRLDLNPVLEKLILNALVQNRDFYVKAFNELVDGGGLEDCLGKITAPTLIVQGNKDRVITPACIDIVLKYIPSAKIVWIDGGAHTLKGAGRTYAQTSISQFFLEHDTCPSSVAVTP